MSARGKIYSKTYLSTINLLLQTTLKLPFLPYTVLIDILLLSIPFGCIARFSNGEWKNP